MGDDSPDEFQFVCPACDTEVTCDAPEGDEEVTCPACDGRVSVAAIRALQQADEAQSLESETAAIRDDEAEREERESAPQPAIGADTDDGRDATDSTLMGMGPVTDDGDEGAGDFAEEKQRDTRAAPDELPSSLDAAVSDADGESGDGERTDGGGEEGDAGEDHTETDPAIADDEIPEQLAADDSEVNRAIERVEVSEPEVDEEDETEASDSGGAAGGLGIGGAESSENAPGAYGIASEVGEDAGGASGDTPLDDGEDGGSMTLPAPSSVASDEEADDSEDSSDGADRQESPDRQREEGEGEREGTDTREYDEPPADSSEPERSADDEGPERPEDVEAAEQSLEGATDLGRVDLREAFGDRRLELRTDDDVFGPIEVDRFVELVQEGFLPAVEAIREPGEDWVEADRHPVVEAVREKLASKLRDRLADREAGDGGSAEAEEERGESGEGMAPEVPELPGTSSAAVSEESGEASDGSTEAPVSDESGEASSGDAGEATDTPEVGSGPEKRGTATLPHVKAESEANDDQSGVPPPVPGVPGGQTGTEASEPSDPVDEEEGGQKASAGQSVEEIIDGLAADEADDQESAPDDGEHREASDEDELAGDSDDGGAVPPPGGVESTVGMGSSSEGADAGIADSGGSGASTSASSPPPSADASSSVGGSEMSSEAGRPEDSDGGPRESDELAGGSEATTGDVDASEPPETGTESGADWTLPIVFGLAVVGAGVVGVALFTVAGIGDDADQKNSTSGKQNEPKREGGAKSADESAAGMAEAVASARQTVREAASVDVEDPELQQRVAQRLVDGGRHVSASRIYDVLWRQAREPSGYDFAERYLGVLMEAKRFRRARMVAVEVVQTDPSGSTFEELYRKSVDRDPALEDRAPVDLTADLEADRLEEGGELDIDGWIVRDEAGNPTAIFDPETSKRSRWQDDVAAWRLCELIACQFQIPRTRPARLARGKFDSLVAEGIDRSELRWRTVSGEDGEVTYLYGSLRDWPGEVVRWPIEAFGVWRPWMQAYSSGEALERPAEESLKSFRELESGSYYDQVVGELDGATVRDLAGQLSGVVSFDYLTNNWGRFADSESAYGSRNHFADGRFVTIWTDTAFQGRKSTRVKGRFGWISRFSRDFLTSVRLLDRDETRSVLYPDASALERQRFEIFWEQRESMLKRIDDLISEHGREGVLAFE